MVGEKYLWFSRQIQLNQSSPGQWDWSMLELCWEIICFCETSCSLVYACKYFSPISSRICKCSIWQNSVFLRHPVVISGFRVCFFNNCIGKNQNKAHFEEGYLSHNSLRDGSRYQIGWILGKVLNSSWPPPPPFRMVPISENHVHAFHTIWPSYLLAYMHPYPL